MSQPNGPRGPETSESGAATGGGGSADPADAPGGPGTAPDGAAGAGAGTGTGGGLFDLGDRAGGARGRRMFRSRRHKVVAGVCGGLGRHFDVDPVVFRVPLAVLSLIGGVGFVAYGIAWLVLPYEEEEENEARRLLTGRVEGAGLTALLFVLVGLGLLLASMSTRLQFFSVLVLGSMVAAAHWSQERGRNRAAGDGAPVDPVTAQTVATAPPEAQPPPAPAGPSWWRSPTGPCAPWSSGGGEYLWGPKGAAPATAGAGSGGGRVNMRKPTDPPASAPAGPPAREPVAAPAGYGSAPAGYGAAPAWSAGGGSGWSPYTGTPVSGAYGGEGTPLAPTPGAGCGPGRSRGFWLGGPVLLAAITAAVLVTGAVWQTVALGPALTYGFAAALAVFGIGMVVGAFVGRLGAGTVIAATMTAVLLLGASVLPRGIETEWRDESWSPVAAAQLAPSYEAGTGRATLDLSGLDLAEGREVATSASLGAGRLLVIVPHDAVVRLSARIGAGGYHYTESRGSVPGGASAPPMVATGGLRLVLDETLRPADGVTPVGTIDLTLDTSVGLVAVERQAVPDGDTDGAGGVDEDTEGAGGAGEDTPGNDEPAEAAGVAARGTGTARNEDAGDDAGDDAGPVFVAAGAPGRVEVNG
ncbi:PspC domain-containing protein [Streptomyces sp. ST2-7A]|uniref:PspC domain-containing protein n=1 Tax=Streptomyces sp. ST2-7A TaxID=2907214 RepID=UPI001F26B02C|nr:PspC domain-containing protein [Streptomyces sp. ST2-7A]MCE7078719.1 PspC domain-containing protein [Streptomyces sp. ST2-7A]